MKFRGKKVFAIFALMGALACMGFGEAALAAGAKCSTTIDSATSDIGGLSTNSTALGLNGPVYELAADASGNLYAAGGFTTAGGVAANHIAKWNGSSWSALGSGIGDNITAIYALAVDSSGNVYVAGNFTAIGGVAANYIAKWDGTSWSALGSGIASGYLREQPFTLALAVDSSDNVYVGGYFWEAGDVSVNHIAKWDGTSWSALGSGVEDHFYIIEDFESPYVYALAVDASDNLYVAGNFKIAGGVTVRRIAKWDGSSWSALGSGLGGYFSEVKSLAVDASGNVYAAGNFTRAGLLPVNHIAKWNGKTWLPMGFGLNSGIITALAADSSGNVYAAGAFKRAGLLPVNHIAKWNGTAWSAMGTGTNGSVSTLVVDDSDTLIAGGYFTTAGGVIANYLAAWDNETWSAFGAE